MVRRRDDSTRWFQWRRIGKGEALIDAEFARYLDRVAPDPDPTVLHALCRDAVTMRVYDDGAVGDAPIADTPHFVVTDAAELAELATLLEIEPGGRGHCMCYGDAAVELLDGDGAAIAVFGIHHGQGLRWDGWGDDAGLVRGRELLEWLAARGLEEPLRSVEEMEAQDLVRREWRRQWIAAIPEPLADFVDLRQGAVRQFDVLDRRLRQAVPDPVDRAVALLRWFGAGSGRCSGFPSYEQIPEPLLLDTPLPVLLGALEQALDDGARWLGAVRLFAGWSFGKQRGSDLARIPTTVKRRLLSIAEGRDEDVRGRAARAFGGTAADG